jgi:branched-chain amino acid transport system ATP-binding protein
MSLLTVEGLTVRYGQVVAVRDVSFAVGSGESVALLGPNGAGKTSCVEAIAGLQPTFRGRVTFQGRDVTGLSASAIARLGLALVPQWRELFPNFSVEETLLAATAAAHGRPPAPLDSVYELFPKLRERRTQLAGSLSGGEQQMLAIGRALMTNPRMILLDEPSAGLAAGIIKVLVDVVRRIRSDDVSILLVEQNVDIARAVARDCYIMSVGAIAWRGPISNTFEVDEIQKAYLA